MQQQVTGKEEVKTEAPIGPSSKGPSASEMPVTEPAVFGKPSEALRPEPVPKPVDDSEPDAPGDLAAEIAPDTNALLGMCRYGGHYFDRHRREESTVSVQRREDDGSYGT